MEKTFKPANGVNLWELTTDNAHILHRIGTDDYTKSHRATVSDPDQWEEIAVADMPPYTKAQYKEKIVTLIREKYDLDDECAILRQRYTKPDEFAEYNTYVEQCKLTAKTILSANSSENENE